MYQLVRCASPNQWNYKKEDLPVLNSLQDGDLDTGSCRKAGPTGSTQQLAVGTGPLVPAACSALGKRGNGRKYKAFVASLLSCTWDTKEATCCAGGGRCLLKLLQLVNRRAS